MITVTLYIGSYREPSVSYFRKWFNRENQELLLLFIENYVPGIYFVGDLSLLSERYTLTLLKFLEDRIEDDIYLYASKDNLNSTILSRCNFIYKSMDYSYDKGEFKDFVDDYRVNFDDGSYKMFTMCADKLKSYYYFEKLPIRLKKRIGDIV